MRAAPVALVGMGTAAVPIEGVHAGTGGRARTDQPGHAGGRHCRGKKMVIKKMLLHFQLLSQPLGGKISLKWLTE